jgi:predicted nucleic acid-binding protein
MIVLDTNVLSELLRPAPAPRVLAWVGRQPRASLFVTSMTRAEVFYGIHVLPRGRRRQALWDATDKLFAQLFRGRMLSFDGDAADAYAEIMAARKSGGRRMSQSDAVIASVARSRGASLATRNVKDFVDCGIEIINPWQS